MPVELLGRTNLAATTLLSGDMNNWTIGPLIARLMKAPQVLGSHQA